MVSLVGRSQDPVALFERREKIKKFFIISLICIFAVAFLLGVIIYFYINRQYNDYTVTRKIKVKNGNLLQYKPYQDGVVKFSRDGVSAVDVEGKELWNGSYDMEKPAIDISGKYVCVADLGAKNVCVYNGKDSGTELTMDNTILQSCISSQGVLAVVLEESTSNVIQVYNPYDPSRQLLVEIPTNVEDGYPVSIDISPDGTALIAAYVCVTSGVVESRVTFYNFTDVGKNTNCLVGSKKYSDRLVADVQFMDADHACLFTEKGFSIWEDMKKPKQVTSEQFKANIRNAFFDENYVGVVLGSGERGKGLMQVYDQTGKRIMKLKVSTDFSQVQLLNDEILMNSASHCYIYKLNGVKRLDCDTKERIRELYQAPGRNEYLLTMDSAIKVISLDNK